MNYSLVSHDDLRSNRIQPSPNRAGFQSRWRLVRQLNVCTIAALVLGCTSGRNTDSDSGTLEKTNRIIAVSYALQYLTERIAGESYEVEFPAASSPNPRTWKPTVDEIASMQRAGLVVVNGSGAEYAQWLVQTTLPQSIICSSCDDLKLRELISVKDFQIVHSHGPEGEHSHAYMVPYPWLDPAIAIRQAETIAAGLKKNWPEDAELFESNLSSLKADLKKLVAALPGPRDETVRVYTANPHLKYLTRAAGMEDIHLLWFESPTEAEWESRQAEFEKRTAEIEATRILMTDEPAEPLASYLSQRNVSVIQINTLDHQPPEGDYLTIMRQNIDRLKW